MRGFIAFLVSCVAATTIVAPWLAQPAQGGITNAVVEFDAAGAHVSFDYTGDATQACITAYSVDWTIWYSAGCVPIAVRPVRADLPVGARWVYVALWRTDISPIAYRGEYPINLPAQVSPTARPTNSPTITPSATPTPRRMFIPGVRTRPAPTATKV